MSFVDEREKKIYKQKALNYLVEVRNVGELCKYHIFDLIDPGGLFYRNNQFIMAALVTVEEILNEDHSALDEFEAHMKTVVDRTKVRNGTLQFGRCAFVKNAATRYFHEHGECRLLDPTRHILFKIIDKGYEECGAENGFRIRKTYSSNISDRDMLRNMKINFEKMFSNTTSAVLILFSHYIPCTVPFHECARLLNVFVQESDQETVVGYERLYPETDKLEAHEWLSLANITVFKGQDIRQEMERQNKPLSHDSTWDRVKLDHYRHYNTTENIIDSFPKKRHLHRNTISKTVKRSICKSALKMYLENRNSEEY